MDGTFNWRKNTDEEFYIYILHGVIYDDYGTGKKSAI